MPPQPSSVYHALTRSHRDEIVDHVRGCIATFRGPALDGDDINDLVRWTLEGFGRAEPYEDAYAEGFENGREAMHEEIAALAPAEADA